MGIIIIEHTCHACGEKVREVCGGKPIEDKSYLCHNDLYVMERKITIQEQRG